MRLGLSRRAGVIMKTWISSHKRWIFALLLLAVPGLGAWRWFSAGSVPAHSLASSMIVLIIFLVGLLALLDWAAYSDSNDARKEFGFLQVALGADGRVSTSKTVGALWTLTFASALMTLTAMVWFGGLSVDESFGGDWDAYLILLGGPFAAAVMAKGITASKIKEDPASKTTNAAASGSSLPTANSTTETPKAADVVANDSGEISLVDTQYVVFSLVALCYFIGSFVRLLVNFASVSCAEGLTTASATACAQSITLPQIPPSILGLTSLAALTYVGNKAVQTSGIRLADTSPNPVKAGEEVTITVVNLVAQANKNNTTVLFRRGDEDAITAAPSSAVEHRRDGYSVIHVNAPAGAGSYRVIVVALESVSATTELTVE